MIYDFITDANIGPYSRVKRTPGSGKVTEDNGAIPNGDAATKKEEWMSWLAPDSMLTIMVLLSKQSNGIMEYFGIHYRPFPRAT